jgi:Uma2 family endonuclease
MILERRLTVDEYFALPKTKPYLEYVHGKAAAKPVRDKNHMRIAGLVGFHLVAYSREHGGFAGPEGRSEFSDRPDNRFLLPNLSYFSPDRPSGSGSRLAPPALAVEIRSHDQSLADLREKCNYYIEHGVASAWLIDPRRRTVELFVPGEAPLTIVGGGPITSPALPGLEIALGEIFADLE